MSQIQTFSGLVFDYANPTADTICLHDIVQGLTHETRFCGQAGVHYSVAQHSILTSHLVPDEYKMEALLHDASEAYMKDIPSPLKALLPDYQAIERNVMRVIRQKFGLPEEESATVKQADRVMLFTERRDLLRQHILPWGSEVPPAENITIYPWEPGEVMNAFYDHFYFYLTREGVQHA